MKRVGIVGLGFMGMVHYLSYQKLQGVQVVAVCDTRPELLTGDWTSVRGNFGPPGQQMDLSGIATYASAEELIADPQVDLVDITLPPFLHAEVALAALAAGKHVFTEKPMAMTVADCDRMVAAANRADRHLLVGHVLPFFPEYAWALQEIGSEKQGRLLGGSFKRVISDPDWLANYWSAELVGGPMLDLHVHDAHFIRLVLGMPTRVASCGSVRDGLPEDWHSVFEFAGSKCFAHATCGCIRQAGRPFLHGFEIRLERATLMFEFAVQKLEDGQDEAGYLCPPTILDESGQARRVTLGDGDPMHAFEAELGHAVRVVSGDASPGALACELARDAIEICRLESQNLLTNS
jgi:predicted dehydrogenase